VCTCLQSCREDCDSLVMVRTFLYDCWFDGHTYNRSTTSTSYVDFFRSPRQPPCSTSLDAALPPRFWPRTSQTAAGADDPTPAGFASAATSALYFLRRSNGGTTSCCFERCCVERYIFALVVIFVIRYSICPSASEMTYIVSSGALNSTHSLYMSDDLPERF